MNEVDDLTPPPFLSSSLQRILRTYEDADTILFEPVSLPKANQINSPNFQTRKSGKTIAPTAKLHSNPLKPLPSLAEDEDTMYLRSQVSELEHQSLDLTVQIQLTQQKIEELEKQLASLATQNVPASKARKFVKSPTYVRGKQITPRGMNSKNLATYYRDKFEKVKAQYEGLTKVLSQHGQNPLTTKR